MALVPATGPAPKRLERIGCGIVVKLSPSPCAGVRKSLAVPHHEINVMQGVRHSRRTGGLRTLFRVPMDLCHLGAVGERLAVAGNAGSLGVDLHGIGEDHLDLVSGLTDGDSRPFFESSELTEREP